MILVHKGTKTCSRKSTKAGIFKGYWQHVEYDSMCHIKWYNNNNNNSNNNNNNNDNNLLTY